MPKSYQNIGFDAGKSQFVDAVSNTVGPNTALFANATKQAPLAGGAKAAMVSGSLTINVPKVYEDVGAPDTVLNESFKMQWNLSRADAAKLTALRAEANRLLDKAIADYNLTMGLVPPVYANFAEA